MLMLHIAGSILRALDSVGLSILYWIFGFIIAAGNRYTSYGSRLRSNYIQLLLPST